MDEFDRTPRRHELTKDVGASRQQIQDAVLTFQRRQQELIIARTAALEPVTTSGFQEIKTERVVFEPAPLGAMTQQPPAPSAGNEGGVPFDGGIPAGYEEYPLEICGGTITILARSDSIPTPP